MLTPSLDFTIHSTDFVEIVTHGGHRFTAHFGGDVWRGPGRKVKASGRARVSGQAPRRPTVAPTYQSRYMPPLTPV